MVEAKDVTFGMILDVMNSLVEQSPELKTMPYIDVVLSLAIGIEQKGGMKLEELEEVLIQDTHITFHPFENIEAEIANA